MGYEIEVVELAPQDTAVFRGHAKVEAMGDFLGLAFRQVMGALGAAPVAGAPFARYSMGEDGFDVEAGFPVPSPFPGSGQVEGSLLPGGPTATTMHVGSYMGLGGAYSAIEEWMTANDMVPASDPWEAYLDEPEADAPRTIVCWPVQPA
jgi:effector-binding domain-containing protein